MVVMPGISYTPHRCLGRCRVNLSDTTHCTTVKTQRRPTRAYPMLLTIKISSQFKKKSKISNVLFDNAHHIYEHVHQRMSIDLLESTLEVKRMVNLTIPP